MLACEVLGNVVSTVKIREHEGRKIMIVRQIDENRRPVGKSFLALDLVGCGPGEQVLVCKEGGSSRIAYGDEKAGVHSTITAIIDSIEACNAS